jgi:predicted ester cyclase
LSTFPDWYWEIQNLFVDGDYIAVHFTVTGTHQGPSRELRRPIVVTISEFTFYRIENGKFAEV